MAALQPPSRDEFARISQVQQQREHEYKQRLRELRSRQQGPGRGGAHGASTEEDLSQAATVIQKTYRGYRARRELDGYGLDASTRWTAALREAQFRTRTRPVTRSPTHGGGHGAHDGDAGGGRPEVRSPARSHWSKAATVARRAGTGRNLSDDVSSDGSGSAADEKEEQRRERRQQEALVMKMQYFLEMVDLKHRHGSNLRKYHAVWKQSDTKENFFYWLDHGEGRAVDLEACPREKLERDQVRYLSREERQYYLVTVDEEGRLCWAKNGARIDTSEKYKDSIHGIVPADDPTPAYNPSQPSIVPLSSSLSSTSSSSSLSSESPAPSARPSPGSHHLTRLIPHPSAKSKWIFVSDLSHNLYVGIKSSGAFQHSSFLQGSRILAAGLIRIRRGRLSSISPLSGHYRPPAGAFRGFIQGLRGRGVDMSAATVGKAYVVVMGLEMYVGATRRGKRLKEGVFGREKGDDDEVDAREAEGGGAREKALEKEAREEEEHIDGNKRALKVMEKLKIPIREPAGQRGEQGEGDA